MSIMVNIRYGGKDGAARAFAREMTESGTVAKIRAEAGNLRYEYFLPLDGDGETVLLIDAWENQAAIDEHHAFFPFSFYPLIEGLFFYSKLFCNFCLSNSFMVIIILQAILLKDFVKICHS